MSGILDFILSHGNHKLKRYEKPGLITIDLVMECTECKKSIVVDVVTELPKPKVKNTN